MFDFSQKNKSDDAFCVGGDVDIKYFVGISELSYSK